MTKQITDKKRTYILWGFILISTIISAYLKFIYRDYTFSDYLVVLERWVGTMQSGGIITLKDPFYNYTPAYMYVLYILGKFNVNSLYTIKVSSILFEYIAAFYVGRLAFMLTKKDWMKWLPLGIIPLLPSVIINSAFMSQCDAIYVTFMVASVYYVFKGKQVLGIILLGVAFAFKFQAIMIMPFYFVYMLRGHIKWYLFLLIPLTYIVSILPVALMGRNFFDLLFYYITQANSQDWRALSIFFPNIYIWIHGWLDGAKWPGYLFVSLVTLFGGLFLKNKKFTFDLKAWFTLLLLSAIFCPFFLPGMHERYMYFGDVVAFLYVIVNYRNIMNWFIGLYTAFVSWFSVTMCLATEGWIFDRSGFDFSKFDFMKNNIKWQPVAFLYLCSILYLVFDLCRQIGKSDGKQEFSCEKSKNIVG